MAVNDDLFARLVPFPAPQEVDLLMWNGAGWFVGWWDGNQFREQGSGWVCDVDENCGYLLLPEKRVKYELMTPENRLMGIRVAIQFCRAIYPGDPYATSHVYASFFMRPLAPPRIVVLKARQPRFRWLESCHDR